MSEFTLEWVVVVYENRITLAFSSFLMLISATLFLCWNRKKVSSVKQLNQLPSPPKLPIIGNLHQLGILVHRSLHDLSQKYGQIMLVHFGQVPFVIITSAEIAREIRETHDVAFSNRAATIAVETLVYSGNDVGFSPYGEYWKQARRILAVELLSNKKVLSFGGVREDEVAKFMKSISRSCVEKSSICLFEMMLVLNHNITSRCAFRRNDHGEEYGDTELGQLLGRFMDLFGSVSFGDLFPWLGWMDVLSGSRRKMKKIFGQVDHFLEDILDQHLNMEKDNYDPDGQEKFIDLLLRIQKDDSLGLTRTSIKALMMDVFLGASHTSAITVEWAMAELMKKPDVMQRAQEEVRKVIGQKSRVTEEDISSMKFLKCIVKETLRLHPPVPLIPRLNSTSTVVNGYEIPAGTRVLIDVWAIQRDANMWTDPHQFFPTRFEDNGIDFKGHDFDFIPFGTGRRICPGLAFAASIVELVMANLLYWFDWELPAGKTIDQLDMSEAHGTIIPMKFHLRALPKFYFSQSKE